MNIQYLPCSSYNAGVEDSHTAWLLVCPTCSPTDTTQYLYPIIVDLQENAWALIDLDSQVLIQGEVVNITTLLNPNAIAQGKTQEQMISLGFLNS